MLDKNELPGGVCGSCRIPRAEGFRLVPLLLHLSDDAPALEQQPSV